MWDKERFERCKRREKKKIKNKKRSCGRKCFLKCFSNYYFLIILIYMMLEIKLKKYRKNIILIHFQLKRTFEKHFAPHYQIYTKKRREKPEKKEKYVIFNQFIKTHHNVKNYMYIVKSKITNN
jgi:hypothetical protein